MWQVGDKCVKCVSSVFQVCVKCVSSVSSVCQVCVVGMNGSAAGVNGRL